MLSDERECRSACRFGARALCILWFSSPFRAIRARRLHRRATSEIYETDARATSQNVASAIGANASLSLARRRARDVAAALRAARR